MRPIRLAALALLVGVTTSCVAYGQSPGYNSPPPPRGYDDRYDEEAYYDRYYGAPAPRVEVGFFFDELSPYGDWVRTRDYGWAWFPRHVHPYWRPYYEGRWVITEYGWTWVSYEPFGWATYHYGRWAWDARFGWLWIPGNVWGPAWVSWQYGGGYIGWAPLPPVVRFEIGVGIHLGGFDLRLGIRPEAYSFVRERSFLEPRLSSHFVPTARNVTIIHNTTNITNYTYIDNRVINRGVELRRIEQATGRRVQQRRVAEVRTKTRAEVSTNEVRVYRPERQKLDTVRVAPRSDVKQRVERRSEPRSGQQPAAQRRAEPELVIAPRADRTPRPDSRRLEQEERRERQELERYQANEKRRVEKLQREESARARAQADRGEIERRHREEREALARAERDAAKQLEARQKAKREATLAKPPAETSQKGKERAAAAKKEKDAKKGKAPQEKPAPPPA